MSDLRPPGPTGHKAPGHSLLPLPKLSLKVLFQKTGVGRKREAAATTASCPTDGQLVSGGFKFFTSGISARAASLLETMVSLSLVPV